MECHSCGYRGKASLVDSCTEACIRACIGLSRHGPAVRVPDMVAVFGEDAVRAIAESMVSRYQYGAANVVVRALAVREPERALLDDGPWPEKVGPECFGGEDYPHPTVDTEPNRRVTNTNGE